MGKAAESKAEAFSLTSTRLARVDDVGNINSRPRHTVMRVIIKADGDLAAITEEKARAVEEEMKAQANPQAVKG